MLPLTTEIEDERYLEQRIKDDAEIMGSKVIAKFFVQSARNIQRYVQERRDNEPFELWSMDKVYNIMTSGHRPLIR
jgi:hypothetical protein